MTCQTGKREFGSERSAKRGLRALKNPLGSMHAYKCELCACWHLGHASLLGSVWNENPPQIPGYGRPRDVFSGFIVVGQHQVVFGNLCLSCPAAGHAVDTEKPTLIDLGLPEDLLSEVIEVGDQRVADTLLNATPKQLEQIRSAWTAMHGGRR